MVISTVGLADKRPIIYGLCHVLGKLGKTIVLTANEGFLGASDYKETSFLVQDVQIVVTTREGDQAFIDAEWRPFEYDYVIHDCPLTIPPETDFIIHFACQNKRMFQLEREAIDNFKQLPRETFVIGGGRYAPIGRDGILTDEEREALTAKKGLPFGKKKTVRRGVMQQEVKKVEEKITSIKLTPGMWGYVNEVEDSQSFVKMTDPDLLNICAYLLTKVAKLDEKKVKRQLQGVY